MLNNPEVIKILSISIQNGVCPFCKEKFNSNGIEEFASEDAFIYRCTNCNPISYIALSRDIAFEVDERLFLSSNSFLCIEKIKKCKEKICRISSCDF